MTPTERADIITLKISAGPGRPRKGTGMPITTSYLEGRRIVTDFVSPVGTELCPIELSAGRILAEDLIAAQNVPPFDRSPFDGYVFRAEDSRNASRETPVTLRILEEIPASGVPCFPITAGTASKILTGAPIPEGGDAVVPFEHTEFTQETVTLFSAYTSGTNIVRVGEDIRKGSLLTEKGTLIDPGVMGSLAAQNISRPLVYRRPRVAVLATGSELVELGHDLAPGKIHDSNSYSMAGAIRDQGAEPVYYRAVSDSVEAIAEGLEKSLRECDAVVTTGGVSVGDYDLTPAAMEAIGAEIFFRKVDLKPGMACAYGQKNGKLICGLSGNPASSITNFYAIAMPAFRKLCGLADYEIHEFPIRLAGRFGKASPNNRMLRGFLELSDGTVRMRLSKGQGNVMISGLIGCDVAAVIPAGSGPLEAGTELRGFFLR